MYSSICQIVLNKQENTIFATSSFSAIDSRNLTDNAENQNSYDESKITFKLTKFMHHFYHDIILQKGVIFYNLFLFSSMGALSSNQSMEDFSTYDASRQQAYST